MLQNWMADMESSTLTVKNIDIQCIGREISDAVKPIDTIDTFSL